MQSRCNCIDRTRRVFVDVVCARALARAEGRCKSILEAAVGNARGPTASNASKQPPDNWFYSKDRFLTSVKLHGRYVWLCSSETMPGALCIAFAVPPVTLSDNLAMVGPRKPKAGLSSIGHQRIATIISGLIKGISMLGKPPASWLLMAGWLCAIRYADKCAPADSTI